MKAMSPWQFTIFRILFGSYLCVHFLHLAPWAGELFGAGGLIGDPSINPAHGLFPNPLDLPIPDGWLTAIVVLLAGSSLLFTAGVWRKPAALVLWFGWTALFHRNNLISNPSVPYIGLLLVLSLLVPGGEPWSRGPRNADWAMPKWVFRCAWILMAAGYTFSGITKLSSPSWTDGSAMRFLLENPLARPGWMRDLMLSLPEGLLKVMTWGTLAAELLFLPLALWSRTRPWIWLTLVLMHFGIVAVVDFADLSLGMLMIHLFTFDPAWLKPKAKRPLLVRFDGECLMCSNTIRFVADEDREKLVRFTKLETDGNRAPETMLVETGERTLDRSDGVLAILDALGGHWRAFAIAGRLIPRPLRNALYNFIARHRYRWFGKGDACALPSEALRERLE
ncbi:thiol-disulfide oxidoreductase DCC [Haloferula helveola]|uniref:Thiol-disulfide oxidoreductase DCC n=1 Tax=Haloferula helveola TaxID=490095 RepID=A0ABM7RL95_9BACT|nr:thiol-disulfide oxidoreductase DCC [Haloferula helveola]